MPTLFISYKRGTSAVAPLMQELRAAHYRTWFDRDEIHLGDTDWQARIDQGLEVADGMILCLTPAACESEPVQYEVRKALELGKPIFPVVLEKLPDWGTALTQVGLTPKQHTEDFTDAEQWDAQIERLLRDLREQGLTISRHEQRRERDPNNPKYVLHQRYLRQLAERVGTLDLAKINPEGKRGVYLEDVYIDSPTPLTISIQMQDWQVVDWRIRSRDDRQRDGAMTSDETTWNGMYTPQTLDFDPAPFDVLVGALDEQIADYRAKNPDEKPDSYDWKPWTNGKKDDRITLQLQHIAAAADRLVILGAPGSGKSTFVKHLALCLAGAGLDDWNRDADLNHLEAWTHDVLTPVYVELRRFVASTHFPQDMQAMPTTDHLWAYIVAERLGDDLKDYAADLRYDLEHGHAVLVLDGLDEVPYPEGQLAARQEQLAHLATSIHSTFAGSRVIVASRPYAYEGWKLPGFTDVTITAFAGHHRVRLAERLYRTAGIAAEPAQEKAQALNNQLRSIDPELKDRPLFVTLMATIFLKGEQEGLPTRRGALYRESILLLLERWTTTKANMPSLVELLGDKTPHDLYMRLAALAYDVHATFGDQPGTPEIDEMLLYKHLKPLGRTTAAELIPYLSENAGVLVSPGQDQDDERDVFHFAHRTFQEYLAASHLVELCIAADRFTRIAEHIREQPQTWRVPTTLAGDVLADTNRRGDLWELIEDLLDDDAFDNAAAGDAIWWRVWLAVTITEEQGLYTQDDLRRTERKVLEFLGERTLQVVGLAALPPVERAACGRMAGMLDSDTRPGIGLKDGLPDIVWSEPIPPGNYPIGSDGDAYQALKPDTFELNYTFQIARTPVTFAQFQAFLDASDGYHSDQHDWFTGLAADEGNRQMHDQRFQYANHPRENVTWYQAMAFCRWLSWRLTGTFYDLDTILDWPVRLPTQIEWEIAARGPKGLVYPYGNDFDEAKGNTRETGIGQTSAVGIFPAGASWCGALDMSGNVWEWCLSAFDDGSDDPGGTSRRVVRGGSFFNGSGNARAAVRLDYYPHYGNYDQGFRVLRRPPSS